MRRIKQKVFFSTLIVTVFLLQTIVLATPSITEFTPYAGTIIVKGTHQSSGKNNVMFAVYPEDGDRNKDTLNALGEIKSTNGDFEFAFGLDNSGEYIIIIKADGTTIEKTFSLAGVDDLNDFVASIKSAYNAYQEGGSLDDQKLISDIENIFSEKDKKLVIETLGVNSNDYYTMTTQEKEILFRLFVNNTDFSALNVENVAEGFLIANDLYCINKGENIQKVLLRRNLNFEESQYTTWSNEKQKGVATILMELAPYMSYQDMIDGFNEACMLQNINEEHHVEKIFKVISGYSVALQISSDMRYIDYPNTEKANIKLIQLLSDTPIKTKEQLLVTIQKAKEQAAESKEQSRGGSSLGGTSYYIGNISKPDNISDTEMDSVLDGQKSLFNDMHGYDWAIESVERLTLKGVISGYGESIFAPGQYVTREEFIKMLVVAFGVPHQDVSCSFVDVFNSDWFYPYVGAAEQLGITQGITNDIFGIKTHIIRQDACVMLLRAMKIMNFDVNFKNNKIEFRDGNEIDEYAKEATEQLSRSGIIHGDDQGKMNPKSNLTRAEAAKLIDAIMQEVGL